MKIHYLCCVFITSFFLLSVNALALFPNGQVNSEIDYDDLEFYPPEIQCDEPVVKGEEKDKGCLAKISGKLKYAFTQDENFNATLLFYNIFNEIMAEAEVEEKLRWESNEVDFVDFIYIYPDYDFDQVKNCHHIEWEIHVQTNDESNKEE